MPLIQIQQNSPRVIQDAREQIAVMASGMREEPGDVENHYGLAMHATGFLAALRLYELITPNVYDQLQNELNQVSNAGWAAEDGGAANE